MKRFKLAFYFLVFTNTVFGQQWLWSTDRDTNIKYVPLDSVVSEVLSIYEMYDYYFDGAGFNKQNFFDLLDSTINDSDSLEDFKKLIDETENLKVTAFRANLGEGSAVLIVIISKDYINMIAFSNIFDPSSIQTEPFRKDKFERWFKSLLN